ncbi:hypothetical protein O6H91_03G134200 [Diphasiastrum complanatum]|uniref:Uncharacterized protein n=1 Tax=Diphasiastrum complanatum TaxID=34168 RepID=A0ACC2EBX9_DIPCM|nr:hypothetical protein O6H91_03G134200 [Diphasiastrum complanatum]
MAAGCGVMSGAVLFIEEEFEINSTQVELLMGSLVILSVIGGLISGFLADAIGRRKTMLVAAAIVLFGCGVMGLSYSYSLLLLGRILTGIGIGFSYVIAPLYVAEVSSPATRGMLISFPEIMLNVGILLGYVSTFCLSGLPVTINWRLMLGLGGLLALGLAGGVLIIPESPRWLVVQRRTNEALSVLMKISSSDEEAELRLADIILAAEPKNSQQKAATSVLSVEMCLTCDTRLESLTPVCHGNDNEAAGVWRELLCPSPKTQKILFAALGLQFFQQASGIAVLIYYAPSIFSKAGFHSKSGDLGVTMTIGVAKTVFILIATCYLDTSGRRPLLLISSFGMTASMLMLAGSFLLLNFASAAGFAAPFAVLGSISFVSFFSMGFGPMSGLLASEIFPLRLRAQGVSLSMAMNRLLSGILSLTFLSIIHALSPAGTFFLFAGVSTIATVFVYLVIPETKGRSLEELS